jgi:hypothetical protein
VSRYLGNERTKEVHDIINLKENCKIIEIKPQHRRSFNPDTLEQAHKEGFDNCAWCLGGSTR